MSKENLHKYLIIAFIIFGALFRLIVFWVNPINNSFDDHLEVINIYAQTFNRPDPSQCWECYQPPLYYYICATIYNLADSIGYSMFICWKLVQFINPLLSIFIIIIIYKILTLLKLRSFSIIIILSFFIILPRDIMTAAMIGNDYMLVFFSICSVYFYLKSVFALKSGQNFWLWLILLVISSILGSITKQHGLLILILPFSIGFLTSFRIHRKKFKFIVPILLIGTLLSFSDEIWKFNKTNTILVSNQKYFDYTKNQFPGTLDKVEFFSFRIVNLYKDPFISENTSASLLTELFARTFYDYEWRFISPKIPWAKTLGIIGYTLGLLWLMYFIIIIISILKRILNNPIKFEYYNLFIQVTPIILSVFFILVPLIQTIRFPYFSSMKSMFMLSGIIIFLIIIGNQIKQDSFSQKLGKFLVVFNIIYGILFVTIITMYLEISKFHLHGPLWKLP